VLASKVKELLSERGTVTIDARTNVLIVKEHPDVLAKAEQLVRDLDLPTPQVLIEARIVEVSRAYGPKLGIQWGGEKAVQPGRLVFPSLLSIAGQGDIRPNFTVNMPIPVNGFIFGTAGSGASVNRRLATGEPFGSVKTVSAPKAVTLDNSPASIMQGGSVPYALCGGCTVDPPRLAFTVTPHITTDGSVRLKVEVVHNDRTPQSTASEVPSAVHREASFDLLVKDGDTVVVGGIYSSERGSIERHPRVTALVASDGSDPGTELLVFLSPRIIQRQATVVSSAEP
jgi:type IV pilus assembly protein PilQ